MHQRHWLFALSAMSCLALGVVAQEPKPAPAPAQAVQEVKAGDAIKVAEHRSRWDYPKEVTVPAGSQLYLVVKGDTLWDLGQRFLGNPFAWPQIWDQNKWIKDPHWIYPGDPLIIPVAAKTVATPGMPVDTPADVVDVQPDRIKLVTKPKLEEYGYSFQDFIQLPYLAPKGAEANFAEIGALAITERQAQNRQFLGDTETVYLAGGADRGVKVGDRLVVLKVAKRKLMHPFGKQKAPLGDVVQQVGILRVTTVNPKGSIAVIERSMDAIEVGNHAAPFVEPANIVANLRKEIVGPLTIKEPVGTILYARDNHEQTATGEMVIIDQGAKDGLKVGDILLSARVQTWNVQEGRNAKDTVSEKTAYYLGQVMVVKVGENSASCRILRSKEEMHAGDFVTR
ncbi:MAG: LysM peptidoglycan-binding domain-containing protein [Holophaga sp.]|nr:LysM peptidoglycan-binding domain-containing protein [Holophaga sp.]